VGTISIPGTWQTLLKPSKDLQLLFLLLRAVAVTLPITLKGKYSSFRTVPELVLIGSNIPSFAFVRQANLKPGTELSTSFCL
jgi:hypothetical protein